MTKNFISCEGYWSLSNGSPICDGQLKIYSPDEMAILINDSNRLTQDEANDLIGATIPLFVLVFIFLIIRKALS